MDTVIAQNIGRAIKYKDFYDRNAVKKIEWREADKLAIRPPFTGDFSYFKVVNRTKLVRVNSEKWI